MADGTPESETTFEDGLSMLQGSESGQSIGVETDPDAAQELPHDDLARNEAATLMEAVFEESLDAPAGLYDELQVERFYTDHVAVVERDEGLAPQYGLVQSLLPLRAETETGQSAAVDLDLAQTGGGLEPANPLVDVTIPSELGSGVTLPESSINVQLAGAPAERAPSVIVENAAFYPNVAEDSDFTVIATPTGFETFSQLRTPEAPLTQVYELDLPSGASLQATPEGGARIARDGETVAMVSPPTAMDSEGDPVPVSLEVQGSALSVTAAPAPGSAYPILVDPTFESYYWSMHNDTDGIGTDWRSTSNHPLFEARSYGYGGGEKGLNIYTYGGTVPVGTQANWFYNVPRYYTDQASYGEVPTSFINRMTLSNVNWWIEGESWPYAANPFVIVGLWDSNYGWFAAKGVRTGTNGQMFNETLDMPNPNENTDVKGGGVAMHAAEDTQSRYRHLWVGQAWVELSDKDTPSFGSIKGPSKWINDKVIEPIEFTVSDPGLGIFAVLVKTPKLAGGINQWEITPGCPGNSRTPCPRTWKGWEGGFRPYTPSLMPQGEIFAEVIGKDPVWHFSDQAGLSAFAKVKVDHSAPSLGLSGSLTEQGSLGVNLPEYALNYSSADGDETAAGALSPIGSKGTASGQLERPQGAAVDVNGNVWVTDRINQRIVQLDATGKFVRQIATAGSANGQINEPRGITVGPNGNIWVAETGNKRVQQFTPTGTFVSKITHAAFDQPWGVKIAPNGNVWVTDQTGQIFILKQDGTLVKQISLGQQLNVAGSAFGIDIDQSGVAWVAAPNANKILSFNSTTGSFLRSFGSEGTGPGQFKQPVDIAVTDSGNLVVSDDLNNRVQVLEVDGTSLRQLGSVGSESGQFKEPRGVDVGPGDQLVVADAGNARVARWAQVDRDPQSGVAKVEIKVDGVTATTKAPGCSTKNCAITGSWVLDADNYAPGTHKVEVIATDGVGLTTTKVVNIETHGDQTPPTLALSGSMTEQSLLGTTRPSYKLNVSATDPGSAEERKSGVASTTIKVDGKTVDATSPGCPSGGCSINREWTLTSDSYSVGPHLVEVKATDDAGRSTTKALTINIARDTTPPQLQATNTFYLAPEGWLEHETYSDNATATDTNGYGVTSITLKIDGNVIKSSSGTCPAGGCTRMLGLFSSIDMSSFDGGAHPAELVASDGAGNVAKRAWMINVDPEGHISAGEAEDTLEALDATSPVNTVGPSSSEVAYEGTAEGLEFLPEGELLKAQGSAAPTALDTGTPGELEVEVPIPTFNAACPNRPAEEAEGPRTGEEEEQLAQTVGCEEPPVIPSEIDLLTPVSVTPVTGIDGEAQAVTANSAAAIAENVAPNVDLVTRPLFDGAMTFTAIRDASARDSFSWRVQLEEDQTLTLRDSRTVEVAYSDGPVAFTIMAVPAHDAVGTSVPTSLSIAGDVLTLHVNHRSSSFIYPVVGGAGWEGGFQTYEVVMPPDEAAPGEEGESSEGEWSDQGMYRESTFGPPQPASGPIPFKADANKAKERRYNFHDCRFDANGGVQEPPVGGSGGGNGIVRRAAIRKCHGEQDGGPYGEYFTLSWAAVIHGTYEYEPEGWVWINTKPECKKWGPDQPAKLNCLPGPHGLDGIYKPKLDLLGFFRFAPGTFGPGQGLGMPLCFKLNGVLPNRWVKQENGSKVLEVTFHTYKEWRNPEQPCTWQNMTKIQ